MYIILVYDIQTDDEGKKILPKVFKLCKKYLFHVQNSVFEGEITDSNLKNLSAQLNKLVRDNHDSVIIYQIRQEKWIKRTFIGKQDDQTDNFF